MTFGKKDKQKLERVGRPKADPRIKYATTLSPETVEYLNRFPKQAGRIIDEAVALYRSRGE